MTSKEMLQEIEEIKEIISNQKLKYKNIIDFNLEDIKDALIEVIKQDKILDQLKEILSMDYLVRVYGYEMAKRLQTYLKSNDIVKGWLENGKD